MNYPYFLLTILVSINAVFGYIDTRLGDKYVGGSVGAQFQRPVYHQFGPIRYNDESIRNNNHYSGGQTRGYADAQSLAGLAGAPHHNPISTLQLKYPLSAQGLSYNQPIGQQYNDFAGQTRISPFGNPYQEFQRHYSSAHKIGIGDSASNRGYFPNPLSDPYYGLNTGPDFGPDYEDGQHINAYSPYGDQESHQYATQNSPNIIGYANTHRPGVYGSPIGHQNYYQNYNHEPDSGLVSGYKNDKIYATPTSDNERIAMQISRAYEDKPTFIY